jgi:hypothetical protein
MESVLKRLMEQNAFATLDSWTRLSGSAEWLSMESLKTGECECASVSEVPAAMDVFTYTVIACKYRRTIVIRSGGFAGVQQIFEEKEPTHTPDP